MAGLQDISQALTRFGERGLGTFERNEATRREQKKTSILDRDQATARDGISLLDKLNRGDINGFNKLITGRLLFQMGTKDPSAIETLELGQRVKEGDIEGAKQELQSFAREAILAGILPQNNALVQQIIGTPDPAAALATRKTEAQIAKDLQLAASGSARTGTDIKRLELDREKAEVDLAKFLQARQKEKSSLAKAETKEVSKKNVARISELNKGERARNASIVKAAGFLNAFTGKEKLPDDRFLDIFQGDKASSGLLRSLLTFAPVFTSQGQFDEELDAFAEVAAREKLKAVGEIRPTDADVEGMKRALFGKGRDEATNINLLTEFIEQQQGLNNELVSLRAAKEEGTLGTFIGGVPAVSGIPEIQETPKQRNVEVDF